MLKTFFSNASSNATSATIETSSGKYGRTTGFNMQCSVSGTGAVTATFDLYGSNIRSNSGGSVLGNITLSGTTSVTESVDIPATWKYLYCILSNLTGTGAIASAFGRES